MLEALRRLYQVVDIREPPRIEDYWIVIPAEPALVYPGLQRAVPDWFELFVVSKDGRGVPDDLPDRGQRVRSSPVIRPST